MIKLTCVKCNQDIEIAVPGELKDYVGFDTDCIHCGAALIILEDKIQDFNEYLKHNYESMGVQVSDSKDYTKSFVEI